MTIIILKLFFWVSLVTHCYNSLLILVKLSLFTYYIFLGQNINNFFWVYRVVLYSFFSFILLQFCRVGVGYS